MINDITNTMTDGEVLCIWFFWIMILCTIAGIAIELLDERAERKRKKKIIENRKQQKIYKDAMKWRQQERKKEYENYRKEFKKEYLNIIKEH